MQLKKFSQLCFLSASLLVSSHLHSHEAAFAISCREALVAAGHFDSLQATHADAFVDRAINEMARFNAGHTDAPHMTAEQVARHNTYRIVPRSQTPINEAEVVWVVIHGNGGGNSGPHSLTGIITALVKAGVISEGQASKFYAEAPALPGAEAGPNRANYDLHATVQWTIRYLIDLKKAMKPGAKINLLTRSSGADFGIKSALGALDAEFEAALAKELAANEGLVSEIFAMSPTTTGNTPDAQPRLKAAELGAIDDLSNNGSGLNHSAFGWIMSSLHQSNAWTPADMRPGPRKPKFKFFTGSNDKQVPILEREFDSNLARESDGNPQTWDFLNSHHDTFAAADGYNPHDQAWPIFINYIRQEYLGIPAPDANITAQSFHAAQKKDLGSKIQVSDDIPVTPKTLVEGFEAGYDYRVDDVFVVESEEAARKHYESSPHSRTAVYIVAQKDMVNGFRRASGVPGFSSYRRGAKIPNFEEHAKNGRLRLKKIVEENGEKKEVIEQLSPETFLANEILNHQEILQLASEGRLVERQYQRQQVYYLPVFVSNVETFRTWTKLKGEEQKQYGLAHSTQEKKPGGPQAKENQLINFARSCPRGDILVLPKGWHAESATTEQVETFAKPFEPNRFDPIYFARFEELVDAAVKKKLYIENAKGNIEYISPDALREYIAQPLASRKRSEELVKQVINNEQAAETAGRKPTGNVFKIENGEVTPLKASELTGFMGNPEGSTLTFHADPLSPASLRFHAWSRPTELATVRSGHLQANAKYQQAIENSAFSVQKDQAFWSLMMTAKVEINDKGLPVYDVHSWLLPQVLYNQKNAHSIEIKDGNGAVVAGAILLNRGGRWSIDCLVDVRKLGDPLKLGGPAGTKRKVTSCENNEAVEKAFAEAVKFAFESGAESVEVERVLSQIQPSFGSAVVAANNHIQQ